MAYAGDVTAQQAWERLSADRRSVLVDVRTPAEWSYVGAPDLSTIGKILVRVFWQGYPGMALNPRFAEELSQTGVSKDDAIFFLCRSGARSRAAAEAMTALGYRRYRGGMAGWKASGLPWTQE
jgi:rhodanese-related sulfurtransferase